MNLCEPMLVACPTRALTTGKQHHYNTIIHFLKNKLDKNHLIKQLIPSSFFLSSPC